MNFPLEVKVSVKVVDRLKRHSKNSNFILKTSHGIPQKKYKPELFTIVEGE